MRRSKRSPIGASSSTATFPNLDGNGAIIRLGDVTLADVITGYKFDSPDPILTAAVEERIKRAVWMLLEDAVYDR